MGSLSRMCHVSIIFRSLALLVPFMMPTFIQRNLYNFTNPNDMLTLITLNHRSWEKPRDLALALLKSFPAPLPGFTYPQFFTPRLVHVLSKASF